SRAPREQPARAGSRLAGTARPAAAAPRRVVAACTNPGRAAMRSRVRQGVPGGPACVRFVALLLAGICAWEAEAAKKKSAARG
ncbi:unnamed protein product, partial [Prorocentrum cordatum]